MSQDHLNLTSGEHQPDVNLTVRPSLLVPEFTPLTVACYADIPRYPLATHTSPPLPPVKIIIRFGIIKVKECVEDGITPVDECKYTLTSFFSGIPRRISCTASNEVGACRFKTANVSLSFPTPGGLF